MITNLTALYANGNNPGITGRDIELKNLFLTLLRKEKPNALLVGEAGSGKTALVNYLAYSIANNICPEQLKGYTVNEVNVNSLLAGDGYRGVTEKKFDDLIKGAISRGKTILFMDEFHTVQNLGQMSNNSTPGLGNMLKPYLTRGDLRVIGATTNKELSLLTDDALLRRFNKILVGDMEDNTVKLIIGKCLERYIGTSKIKVNKNVIDTIFTLSQATEGRNPDKAKDITDIVVANAVLTQTDMITSVFVNQTYDEFFMKMEPKEIMEEPVSIYAEEKDGEDF